MKRSRCTVCDYIYDPAKGDPDSGIKPGTPFESLPEDWVCQVCEMDKTNFEPVDCFRHRGSEAQRIYLLLN